MEKGLKLVTRGSRYLASEGIANSLQESEIFLSYVLNCSRVELYLNNCPVDQGKLEYFWQLLALRRKGIPLQYILGCTEFMGLKFKVAPTVFIPRLETEILVESVISLLTDQQMIRNCSALANLSGTNSACYSELLTRPGFCERRGPRLEQPVILDIGCGCGNIAISLAKYLNLKQVFACDISDFALELAEVNSSFHKVRLLSCKSDLFSAFKKTGHFSIVVSNPPYINTKQIPRLDREIQYEPRLALDGGCDGLGFYHRIICQVSDYLRPWGRLCLEVGDRQRAAVEKMIQQSQRLSLERVIKDYNGVERVVIARKIA